MQVNIIIWYEFNSTLEELIANFKFQPFEGTPRYVGFEFDESKEVIYTLK